MGVVQDLILLWCPHLGFLGLQTEACSLQCPGHGLYGFGDFIGRAE